MVDESESSLDIVGEPSLQDRLHRFSENPWIKLILTLLGLIGSIILFRDLSDLRSKPDYGLGYVVKDSFPITPEGRENNSFPRFTISYGGYALSKPHITRIQVVNYGKSVVTGDLFDDGMVPTLLFNNECKIVSVFEIPDKGILKYTHQDNAIKLKPVIMNSGDVARIGVLTDECVPEITSKMRGRNLNSFTYLNSPRVVGNSMMAMLAFMFITIVISHWLWTKFIFVKHSGWILVIGIALSFFGSLWVGRLFTNGYWQSSNVPLDCQKYLPD